MEWAKLFANGAVGGLVAVLYLLVKHVIIPLMRRQKEHQPMPTFSDNARRIGVLEVDLGKLQTRVVDFEALVTEGRESVLALDTKMDVMLEEQRELRAEFAKAHQILGERIAKAETHIEHLLRPKGAGGR